MLLLDARGGGGGGGCATRPNRRSARASPCRCAAYGIVCSATDLRTNERVAIKKVGNIFDNPLDARRTLREVQVRLWLGGVGRGGVGGVCAHFMLACVFTHASLRVSCTCEPCLQARTAIPNTKNTHARRPHQVLRHMRGAPNVISLLDAFPPMSGLQPPHHFQDIYLVYDLMDTDLHQIVRSPQALSGACLFGAAAGRRCCLVCWLLVLLLLLHLLLAS